MERCTFKQIKAFEKRFDSVVMKRIKENSPFETTLQKKHGVNPKKVRNILDRCLYNTKKDPGFLTDLKVPFENNQAEKDNHNDEITS
jgi:transposase